MKLIYSFIDFTTIEKVLVYLFFILPIYTFSQNCTVNANADRSQCPGGQLSLPPDQFYLLGTANADVGANYLQNPSWTQISGNAVNITTPNLVQALVTGAVPGNTYGFRLSAQCADGSTVSDDVYITFLPVTLANAGSDQTYCHGTYALNGNVPDPSETGTWSINGPNNAGITINNANSPNSTITVSGTSSGNTSLIWTITNPSGCNSFDEVIIFTLGGVEPVTAGTDITLSNCYSATQNVNLNGSFGGNTPGQQQGIWTVVSGPNVPTFGNANNNNTSVNGLVEGTYVFRWTVEGTCANGFDEVTVIVPAPTADVTDVADVSSYFCDGRTSTVLQGTVPLYVNETVQWTQTGGPTANIVNSTSPSTLVNGMTTLGTYTFLYTLSNSVTGCVSTGTHTVVLEALISITAGTDQSLDCNVFEATIPVTSVGSGQTSWQIVSGPVVNPILNPPYPSYPTPLVNFSGNSFVVDQLLFSGTYIVRVIKNPNPGSLCETVYDDVVIVSSAQPAGSNAGTTQVLACNLTTAVLAGNIPTRGRGKWSQVSGPSTAVFSDINDPTTTVSSLVNGRYEFRWTISGGAACDVTQSISEVVVSSATPTPANAGNDQSICFGTPVQLQGNAVAKSETGTWTVSPTSGISFSNLHDPNAIATGLAANTIYTFTWTISNGCGGSSDTVDVNTNNSQGANADAGPDQCAPTGTSSITLTANDPSPGNGSWTQISGATAIITTPNQFNTTVTGLTDGDYSFQWTVINVGCSDAADTVDITIAPTITIAQAGPNQSVCDSTVIVSGNVPAAGETGLWEFVSGGDGPIITNPSSPTTTITGLTTGSWVYKWTISRGVCAASSDSVQLNINEAPSTAVAGPDQTVCNQTSVTLAATAPTIGDGLWSLISGPNSPVFSDLSSPVSTLSSLITGEYILEWTTFTGVNCPESKDQVSIKVTEPAAAGSDYDTCLVGPLYLTGNEGSTGTWTYVSGPNTPTVTTTGNNSASVTGLIPGDYIFRYTIAADGACPQTSDDINVTINGEIATPPYAGPDQNFCDAGLAAIQLSASTLDPGTTGQWTKLSGPAGGSFLNASNPNTIFTNPGYGIYVFNWTVNAGTCSSSDQVRIVNAQPPSAAVVEGDNAICGSTTELTATPPTVGTGEWAQVSGPTTAVFSSEIMPTTTVSNLTQTGGVYVFSWTVRNGTLCAATTTNVTITVTADLTTPNAGTDQKICESGTATLAANAITVGTGSWSQFSGPIGGIFSDTASPTATFTPNGAGTYVLRWTSTNLTCTLFDDMTITVDPLPSASNAGTPFSVCQFEPVTLNGNTPTTGTGLWTQVSGGTTVVFADGTSPTTAVFGTQAGVYIFRWSITSGVCSPSLSDVTVTINELPPLADAGPDQTICNTSTASLSGNNPPTGTGVWTFVLNAGNTATITNPNLFNTTVTGISTGTTRLKWTISNGSCTAYSDEVQITKPSDLTTSALAGDTTICVGGTLTLSTTASGSLTPYSYQWQTSANGITGWSDISGQTNASYTTDSALTSGEYYYRVNVSNSCTQINSNAAKLTIILDPVVTSQPIGNTICSGETHSMSVAGTTTNIAAGTLIYQWQSSSDGVSGWANVSGGTGAATTTYTTAALTSNLYFRVRVSQSGSGCETFSDPALVNVTTITAQPTTPAPICDGGIVNINITASLNGGTGSLSYQWQSNTGSGFINETNATATTPNFTSDPLAVNTQFRCLVTSSTTNCVLPSNVVTATIVIDPNITTQPTGGIVCTGGSYTLSVTATGGTPALDYQWYNSTDNSSFTLISGANSNTYTTPALTANMYYRVDVSATGNGCGFVTSNSALVTVIADPVVNQQPTGTTICYGGTHTMNVAASGDLSGGILLYQWESSVNGTSGWTNVTDGTGATTTTYTTAALTSNLYYRVRIYQAASGCEVYSNAVPVYVTTITTQPTTPAPICVGGIVNINIVASLNGGAGTLSYQWQKDSGSGYVNETNASATTSNFTSDALSITTKFRCIVTSSTTNCTITSNEITATVVPDPTITVQPVGTTLCSGGGYTLSVTATNGTPGLTYQWFNSTDNISFTAIPAATASTYTTPALTLTTYYKVNVAASGNGCTTITSSEATVIVLSDISITTQPVLRTNICSGSNATLNVIASGGSGNYTYQWKNSTTVGSPYTDIPGANSASYTTPSLTQNTYYIVTVSDGTQGCDPVVSNGSAIIIPSITTQPITPSTVCVGGTISLSTSASANGGSATFSYQWQSSPNGTTGWTNVSGGTGAATANYTSGGLTATTYYRAVITASTPTCTLITNVVGANVIPDPTITTQPVGGNICEGGSLTMSAGATNGSGNFTYQWQKSLDGLTGWANVTDGTGSNTTTYTTGAVTMDTFYRLQVIDSGIGCGIVNSNAAKVEVFESPLISLQPTNAEACIGQTHTFTVTASGNIPPGTLIYQWQTATVLVGPYTNVTDGTGGTTAFYTTPAYPSAGNRYFRVLISQSEGGCQTISNLVTLKVFGVPSAPIGEVTEQPSCDYAFGTIAISSPDLGTGYEYSIDGVNFQASNIFTNLTSGIKQISVRQIGLTTCISPPTSFTIFNRICAVPEIFAEISGDTGGDTGSQTILDSDLLNGVILNPADVTVTVNSISSYLTFNAATNTVSVAPGTPADYYTLTYTICENANPSNCSSVTETITVMTAGIEAIIDIVPTILNGSVDNLAVINVLTNDKLATLPATTSNVQISVVHPALPVNPSVLLVPVLNIATGNVDVPAGTVSGLYEIEYRICEIAVPGNCDTARIVIPVGVAKIDANDDIAENINGFTGQMNAINAIQNDELNNLPITAATFDDIIVVQESAATPLYPGANVPLFSTTTGNVTIPPGTPADTYYITYHICEKLNPTNCSDASIAIVVDAAPLVTNDDVINNVNGYEGVNNVWNAYTNNDFFNGNAVNITLVGVLTPTILSPATPINGGPVPVLIVATGRVDIPAGTPAGQYQIKYQLCENLNPGHCDDAIITINVSAPPIVATDDLVTAVNGYAGVTNVINAYDNDLLNGGALDLSEITTTIISSPGSINGGPVPTFDPVTGFVTVLSKTPAGEYTFVYRICENLNTGNCDLATITISVVPGQIIAEDDIPFASVNGFIGNPNAINALSNDTLDGVLVNPAEVQINVVIPASPINGSPVPVLNPLTGNVSVPAGAAAGNYFITYRLSENLNLTNNDLAVITIEVVAPTIEANDDTVANINGYVVTANAIDVLTNDTLNGAVTNLNQVAITVDTPATSVNGGLVPVLQPLTGIVSVPAGTPIGDYEIKYHICEKLNSANCSDATVFINVVGAPINAVNDTASNINGFIGATNVVNALSNDTLNGISVISSQVTISNIVPAVSINGGGIPVLDPVSGNVTVPAGTAAGPYTIEYRLTENMNSSNFDVATITINVIAPTIVANNDNITNINGFIGANNVINAITNDRLNSMDIQLIKIAITSLTTTTPAAYVSGNPVPELNIITGNVDIPAGTSSGTYIIHYRICERLNSSNCSEADIVINVLATGIMAKDDFVQNINGYRGGNNIINALTNDLLNGVSVSFPQVNIRHIGTIVPLTSTNGNVPILNTITGNVDVPLLTSSGTYIIQYEICEKLNPNNCSSASIYVIVDRPQVVAEDDAINNIDGYRGAANVLNALTSNDKYDGSALSDLNLVRREVILPATPINGGAVPFLLPATGLVSIPQRTPAGTYQIKYIICDRLNPLNCDEATITVLVVVPPILANDDFVDNINGNTGATNVLNAYSNDTLDGLPMDFLDFRGRLITPASSFNGAPVPVLNELTGNVDVPSGTRAGTYFITYEICGRLNSTNCDQAVITVRVAPAPIDAVDDTATGINGFVGTANAINVLDNDTLNGVLVNPADVLITNVVPAIAIDGGTVPILHVTTGIVSVPAGTTAGTYIIRYMLRESTTLTNNDIAIITMVVDAPVIEANDDTLANINGYVATNNAIDVLTNDTLNGTATSLSKVTVTVDTPATSINGGPVPILEPLTGKVSILAGTPAGNYEIKYHICENLNATNCNDATVYITVVGPQILAVNDNITDVNGYVGDNNVINAVTNDLLNGTAVQLAQINITSLTTTTPTDYVTGNPVPVLNTITGSVDVPAGTSGGTYIIHYSICEKLNIINCSEADIIITVNTAAIIANNDVDINVNGYIGDPNALNVLDNDSFNNSSIEAKKAKVMAINISQITITILDPADPVNGNINVPVLDPATGIVSVPPQTPAGLYTIRYRIAENLNPANFDDATVFITVRAAVIEANNDTVLNINGFDGQANVINAITNDNLNGVTAQLAEVTIGVVTTATPINGGPVPTLDIVSGNVSVTAGTPSGMYTIRYSICENLNPTNCSQADIIVTVISGPIIANDDNATGINGLDGANNVINVLTNDLLDNVAPTLSQVAIHVLSPADPIYGAAIPVLNPATGLVNVPPGTASGIYTIVYEICENLNTINCDQAVIKVAVSQPSITLIKRGVFFDTNGDGYAQPGELIRYTFRVTDTGTIDLSNVVVTDPKATITGSPIALLPIGQFNTTNYTGTYVLTQADINLGFVVNQAVVRAQPTVGVAIQELSDSDDPTLIGENDPTITPVIQFKDLTLIKGGQLTGTGGAGSIINYSFTVRNTGNVTLTNVVITDPMLTTTSIAVTPGTLAPGATGTATASYTIKVADVANGVVINTALAIGDDPSGNPVTDVSDSTDPTLTGDDDPTVIDLTLRPSIALVKTATFNDENKNGYAEIGETVTYHFAVTNTGNVVLVNIVVKDPKPGITITGGPIVLRQGETNTTAFVGTYVLTAADIDAGLIENQAEVTAISPDGLTAKDLSDDNSNVEDDPTILPLNACKVTIYNAVSPDGDGKNEIFKIDGIECYANAYVQIYDRWGVLVYDAYNYDNNAVAFRGISEGRATINKQKGLPDGTYFYVITYTTYLNEPISKTGYLYLSGNN
jgi:gliding motility-associated-like protein